jgi:uncharacterized SAM-dependent methyltransferase
VKYFKNTELAKLYNVSEKSVRNWVHAASEGKLELQLFEEGGKLYIASSSKNSLMIEELALKGKKFKNTRGHKVVKPSPKFYELYSHKQIFDIISNIDVYREIPLQYCYFNGGAKHWDTYTKNLMKDGSHNPLTNTLELLDISLPYLDKVLEKHTRVNVIDIGVGNAFPIKGVLEHFLSNGKLGRYIGIDISNELLSIAEQNIKSWFGSSVKYEGYVKDFNYDRFDDLLLPDSFDEEDESVVNLIFFLGGTINNLREPSRVLATIHDSMGKNDLFLFSKKLDTEKSRRHFDVAAPGNLGLTLVLDFLNIDPEYYEIEQSFNTAQMAREAQARLKVSLRIEFELDGQRRTLELNKDESILLWRARHQTALQTIEQFDDNGFDLIQATKSEDQEYLLMTSRIKTPK